MGSTGASTGFTYAGAINNSTVGYSIRNNGGSKPSTGATDRLVQLVNLDLELEGKDLALQGKLRAMELEQLALLLVIL